MPDRRHVPVGRSSEGRRAVRARCCTAGPGLDHHEFGDYLDPLTERGYPAGAGRPAGPWADPSAPPQRRGRSSVTPRTSIMLARAMRLDRYAVLGHSYGAFVALQNAVDYPGMAAPTIVSARRRRPRDGSTRSRPNLLAFEPASLRARWPIRGRGSRASRPPRSSPGSCATRSPFHFADPMDPRIDDYLSADRRRPVYSPDVLRHFAAGEHGGDRGRGPAGRRAVARAGAGRASRPHCVPEARRGDRGRDPGSARWSIFERSGHMAFVEEPERLRSQARSTATSSHRRRRPAVSR